MEPMVESHAIPVVKAIVPTIALPLAAVTVFLNAVISTIAAWFGFHISRTKTREILKSLVRPRIIIFGIGLNLAVWGIIQGFIYWKNLPASVWRIRYMNSSNRSFSEIGGRNTPQEYTDWVGRATEATVSTEPMAPTPPSLNVRQLWRTQLPQGVFGGVTLSGNSLFVGSDDGRVYELDQLSGKILRSFWIGTAATPQPVVWRNLLYVGEGLHDSHHSRIYVFDLISGKWKGVFQTKGHTEGQPVIATVDGTSLLLIMAGHDGVYGVDPISLQQVWHHPIGHADSEVKVDGSRVFFSTGLEKDSPDFKKSFHRLYSLDFHSGKIIWQADLSTSGWMPPVMIDQNVCVGLGEIYSKSKYGEFACFNKGTGQRGPSIGFDSPVLGIPLRAENQIFITNLRGQICSISDPALRLAAGDATPGRLKTGTSKFSQLQTQWCTPQAPQTDISSDETYASVSLDPTLNALAYPSPKDGILIIKPSTGEVLHRWKPEMTEGTWGKSFASISMNTHGWFMADTLGQIRRLRSAQSP